MSRRWNLHFVKIVLPLVILAVGTFSFAEEPAKRPNILWIVSEDNGTFLGCYGCKDAKTPNLDNLAKEGVRYEYAFSAAPVCAPSRHSIITGCFAVSQGAQHMRSTMFVPPERYPFFTKFLRDAGYFCTNNSKTDYNLRPMQKDAWNQISGGNHKQRQKGQRFFAVYNLGTTHESSLHQPIDKSLHDAQIEIPPYHPNTPELRASWAKYHQIVSKMDAQVGEILKKLETEGVADDTIVFYYSDHAGILPRSKRFLYDTGTHVPLIVRFGKNFAHLAPQKSGETSTQLVSLTDLGPTVLSLAGIEPPPHMQGRPFCGEFQGKPRDYVFSFRDRMDERYDISRTIRDRQFRYIRNFNPHRSYGVYQDYLWRMPAVHAWEAAYQQGKCNAVQSRYWQEKPAEELYDTQHDPWEVNDLANDPKYADILKKMRATLREEMLALHDSGLWPEGEMHRQAELAKLPVCDLVRDEKLYPLARLLDVADLATARDEKNLPTFLELMRDPHPAIRYWGVLGCVILKAQAADAKPALIECLKDESPDVRVVAAEALAQLEKLDTALPVLQAELTNPSQWAALRSANVLDLLGPTARPALENLRSARSRDEYLGRVASHAIKQLESTAEKSSRPTTAGLDN